MSSGCAACCMGTGAPKALTFSSDIVARISGVQTGPGATALTRILRSTSAWANDIISALLPTFSMVLCEHGDPIHVIAYVKWAVSAIMLATVHPNGSVSRPRPRRLTAPPRHTGITAKTRAVLGVEYR
jgi:hypothetical protein